MRPAEAGGRGEEGFCGAETEEEVEADGEVVLVVSDVEGDYLTLFLLISDIFHEGEDEAVVSGVGVLHLKVFLTTIDEGLFLHALAVGHREAELQAGFVVGRVEGTGPHHHGNHIVGALVGGGFCGGDDTVGVHVTVADIDFIVCVTVPGFIDIVALAFERALAVIEGNEVWGDVGLQGVAHHEEAVGALAAPSEQSAAEGGLSLVADRVYVQGGGACLYPDELPVEVETVLQVLATEESPVLKGALGRERGGEKKEEKEKKPLSGSPRGGERSRGGENSCAQSRYNIFETHHQTNVKCRM